MYDKTGLYQDDFLRGDLMTSGKEDCRDRGTETRRSQLPFRFAASTVTRFPALKNAGECAVCEISRYEAPLQYMLGEEVVCEGCYHEAHKPMADHIYAEGQASSLPMPEDFDDFEEEEGVAEVKANKIDYAPWWTAAMGNLAKAGLTSQVDITTLSPIERAARLEDAYQAFCTERDVARTIKFASEIKNLIGNDKDLGMVYFNKNIRSYFREVEQEKRRGADDDMTAKVRAAIFNFSADPDALEAAGCDLVSYYRQMVRMERAGVGVSEDE